MSQRSLPHLDLNHARIGYLLRWAQASARNAFDAVLRDFDITAPQFAILFNLERDPGLSSADLSRRSTLTPQAVNGTVIHLEARGLLDRRPHPVHGRILQIGLTPSGRALLKRCKARVYVVEREMLKGLSPDQEAFLRNWLSGVADRLRALAEAGTPARARKREQQNSKRRQPGKNTGAVRRRA